MSLPLEEKIMAAIGLGMEYNWYNESGSCAYIRRKAVILLKEAIQKEHDAGSEISEPQTQLINYCRDIANNEEKDYILTKTWQVCSDTIRLHMNLFHNPEYETKAVQVIKDCYPIKTKQFNEDWYSSINVKRR
jgi:hypothetical protein